MLGYTEHGSSSGRNSRWTFHIITKRVTNCRWFAKMPLLQQKAASGRMPLTFLHLAQGMGWQQREGWGASAIPYTPNVSVRGKLTSNDNNFSRLFHKVPLATDSMIIIQEAKWTQVRKVSPNSLYDPGPVSITLTPSLSITP